MRRSWRKVSLVLFFCTVLLAIYWKKEAQVHEMVVCLKERFKIDRGNVDSLRIHKQDNLIDQLPCLLDEEDAWYTKYHILAHGGGGIDGKCNTNSMESLELHYSRGTRLFDVDILFTTDSIMVCRHSWKDNTEQVYEPHHCSEIVYGIELDYYYYYYLRDGEMPMDSAAFMSHQIFGTYTPMTMEDLLIWLQRHDDAVIFPDFKGDIAQNVKALDYKLRKMNMQDLWSRIVIRIRDFSEYDSVRALLPSDSNIMLKGYDTSHVTYYDILSFCVLHNVHCLALTAKRADDSIIMKFHEKGVHVFVAVIDYLSDAAYYKERGAYGFVSNFLYEESFSRIINKEAYGR